MDQAGLELIQKERTADQLGVERVVRAVTIAGDIDAVQAAWRDYLAGGVELEEGATVRFRTAPGDRGTELIAELWLDKPSRIAALVEKIVHKAPGQLLGRQIRDFKQIVETGEVLISDATVNRGTPHPAQPSRAEAGAAS